MPRDVGGDLLDQQGFVLPEAKPTTRELPDRLSDLILVAVEDLEKVEASSRYKVSMHCWHLPHTDHCGVCLAGSVMAFSLGADPDVSIMPHSFPPNINAKLRALNLVRGGDISFALETLDPERGAYRFFYESMVGYEDDPTEFKAQLRSVARRLAAEGL